MSQFISLFMPILILNKQFYPGIHARNLDRKEDEVTE